MSLVRRLVAAAGKLLEGKPLTLICIVVWCCMFWLGLWPFHSPTNDVAWLSGANGLRFGDNGTIASPGELQPGARDSGCSIELWLQPARRDSSNTLLAFYTPGQPVRFALRQSEEDLVLQVQRGGTFYIGPVFRSTRPLFLTVVSGAHGTAVYVNGISVSTLPRLRVAPGDCGSRLVMGTSPVGDDSWSGVLSGVAVYLSELTPLQAASHYQTWTATGRPELAGAEACIGLYLFTERRGQRVHNQIAHGEDLLIPARYTIAEKTLLMPFWDEFAISKSYGKSVIKNIVGLVPLGFVLYAWLGARMAPRRAAWIVTLLGAATSITIEILQAYLPTRQSGTSDILTNTLGTWLGLMLYRFLDRHGLIFRTNQ
jgi:hypothetical protein